MSNMEAAITDLENNPSLLAHLKRVLGDDNMSFATALRLAIEQASEFRGLRLALHETIVRNDIPTPAERFVSESELKYARIRNN